MSWSMSPPGEGVWVTPSEADRTLGHVQNWQIERLSVWQKLRGDFFDHKGFF